MTVSVGNAMEHLPSSERVVSWFDRLGREHGCDGHSLFQLYARYVSYYAARIPTLHVVPGEPNWRGDCPFCVHELLINTMTGWWSCCGCRRQGEVYAMEYLLCGEEDPASWDDCRRSADALMEGAHLDVYHTLIA